MLAALVYSLSIPTEAALGSVAASLSPLLIPTEAAPGSVAALLTPTSGELEQKYPTARLMSDVQDEVGGGSASMLVALAEAHGHKAHVHKAHGQDASPPSTVVEPCWWFECHGASNQHYQWLTAFILGLFLWFLAAMLWMRADHAQEEAASKDGTLPKPPSKRIGWYDNVKLFAIIGVAIDHAIMFAPGALSAGLPIVTIVTKVSGEAARFSFASACT
jgi:hypothetical protein